MPGLHGLRRGRHRGGAVARRLHWRHAPGRAAGGTTMASTRSEWLQQVPIFGALSDDSVRFLLARSREVEVPAGGYFFRENEMASAMYVLDAGRAVVVKGWHGAAIELRR